MTKIFWITILITIITLIIIVVIASLSINPMKEQVTYIQCCGGNVCSDTYYTPEDNLCHLVLCENSILFTNKQDCVYQGANVSINMT